MSGGKARQRVISVQCVAIANWFNGGMLKRTKRGSLTDTQRNGKSLFSFI
ncbi:MAG: hypothetical protein WCO86_01200 [Planctomycetota bacterium]